MVRLHNRTYCSNKEGQGVPEPTEDPLVYPSFAGIEEKVHGKPHGGP